MKETILWLDDIRDPEKPFRGDPEYPSWSWVYNENYFEFDDPKVVWVKNFDEFKAWIRENGLPGAICFDHDLGIGHTGKDAADWLVEYCLDNNKELPLFASQSDNPVGKKNIENLLTNFRDRE